MREWRIDLPFTKPVTLNDRMIWQVKHTHRKRWRAAAKKTGARQAGIPELAKFTVVFHYRPIDNRRRDTDNLVQSLKWMVDGLVDAGVCIDDDPTHYRLTEPVIHGATRPRQPGQLWLVVRDLGDEPGTQTLLPLERTDA